MKQIQTALELFFNDKNRYPTADEWSTGKIYSTSTGGTSTYMQIIPTAPTPSDGACSASQNAISYMPAPDGSSYSISFCLGNTTGSLPAGPKCLTPGGIINGDCSILPFALSIYGEANGDSYSDINTDGTYAYAVGTANNANGALLTKYSLANFNVVYSTVIAYNNGTQHGFFSAVADADHVYAIGWTRQTNGVNPNCMIARFNKADLALEQIVEQPTSGGIACQAGSIAVDGNNVYFSKAMAWSGNNYGTLFSVNKDDLTQVNFKR